MKIVVVMIAQRELFLSKVNNRETIVGIEGNNDTFCPQKGIKVPAGKSE